MIHVDEKGNRFIVTVEGTRLPLAQTSVNIEIKTALSNGVIVPVCEALAIERSLAEHWLTKYQESLTTIADLREQLQAKG